MRLFFALPIPEPAARHATDVQAALRDRGVRGRWVHRGNLHFTVFFLGEVDEQRVAELMSRVDAIAEGTSAVELHYAGVAGFGRPPRVLFLDWDAPDSGFATLVTCVRDAVVASGIDVPEEVSKRRAVPHLTLVRFRSPDESSSLRRLVRIRRREWEWQIPLPVPAEPTLRLSSLRLYRSTLTPDGPIYDVLREAVLPGRA